MSNNENPNDVKLENYLRRYVNDPGEFNRIDQAQATTTVNEQPDIFQSTFVNGYNFGMRADHDGVSGTDNVAPLQRAVLALKALGGGTLVTPHGSGGMWFNGDVILSQMHGITFNCVHRQYDLDSESPTKSRFVFTSAAYGVKISDSMTFNIEGLLIDGTDVSTNPLYIDRLSYSSWRNVGVIRAATLAWEFDETTGVANAGNKWNVFENCFADKSPKLMEVRGMDGASGEFHTTFVNFSGSFSGVGGIDLIEADNISFIDSMLFRITGIGYGFHWTAGGATYPNSIYFLHCQPSEGGFSIDSGVTYPGICFGYDMSNGAPWPALPTGCIFPIFSAGINSVGSDIPEEFLSNTITRNNGTAGKVILDAGNRGIMRWNSNTGNGVLEQMNDTSRANHRSINPDGSGFILTSKEAVGGFDTLAAIRPGTPAGAFQNATGVRGCTGVPVNADGANGEWCVSDNGHLYFRTGGVWVEKV